MHVLLNDETLHYTKVFFSLVIQNNRSEYLLPIIKSFCRKYEEYAHVGRVKLCVARVISEQNKQQLVNYLKNKFGFLRVCLDIILDRSLIGGFVVCVNENLYWNIFDIGIFLFFDYFVCKLVVFTTKYAVICCIWLCSIFSISNPNDFICPFFYGSFFHQITSQNFICRF